MFKSLKKPANTGYAPKETSTLVGRQCPKCDYIRRRTDTAPAWQCPHCQVAYNKFDKVTGRIKEDVRSGVNRFRASNLKQKLKSLENQSLMLALPGFLTFLNGLPSDACVCNGVVQAAQVASPGLLLLGGAIMVFAGWYYVNRRRRLRQQRPEQ